MSRRRAASFDVGHFLRLQGMAKVESGGISLNSAKSQSLRWLMAESSGPGREGTSGLRPLPRSGIKNEEHVASSDREIIDGNLESKMFQSPLETEDRADRSQRRKVIAVTIGVFVVIVAIIVYMGVREARQAPLPGQTVATLTNAYRAGSPEFEEYQKFVTVEDQDATEADNLLGQKQVVTRGFLTNQGQRTLTGVEVRAILYDLDNRPVAGRVAVPIPKQRARLGPNESMPIQVNIDTVPPRAAIAKFEIVVQGLKFE